jgi:hypothetical protein
MLGLTGSSCMIGLPLAAKKRVDDALEALRIGLTPYVRRRMDAAFDDEDEFKLDAYALLKIILDNWHQVFKADKKLKKIINFVHLALNARNEMAHFVGKLEPEEALGFLHAIHVVLRAIEATSEEEIVLGLYTQQLSGMTLPPHVAGQLDATQKSGAPPTPHVSVQPSASAPNASAPVATSETQADRIRQFARDQYVAAARRDGLTETTIRAGDVHREMGLANAMPAVCGAIGGKKFEHVAHVKLAERRGPPAGSNVYFQFTLNDWPPSAHQTVTPRRLPAVTPSKTNALDLEDALVLISCVKSKLARPAPARLLYTSAWFRGVRDIVEARGAPWFLLSSLYGLVVPDEEIAPYDRTLNDIGVSERQAWANKVLQKLLPIASNYRRIVIFAGLRYREFLIRSLEQRGIVVDIPMEHLLRGEQLAWLNEHR